MGKNFKLSNIFTLEELAEISSILIDDLRDDDEESALEYIDNRFNLTELQRKYFRLPSKYECRLQAMVDEPSVQLYEMHANAFEPEFKNGLYTDCIYTYENLKDVLIAEIEQDHECEELFKALQLRSEFYLFDDSTKYNGAIPIRTKEDMKNVLLKGYM